MVRDTSADGSHDRHGFQGPVDSHASSLPARYTLCKAGPHTVPPLPVWLAHCAQVADHRTPETRTVPCASLSLRQGHSLVLFGPCGLSTCWGGAVETRCPLGGVDCPRQSWAPGPRLNVPRPSYLRGPPHFPRSWGRRRRGISRSRRTTPEPGLGSQERCTWLLTRAHTHTHVLTRTHSHNAPTPRIGSGMSDQPRCPLGPMSGNRPRSPGGIRPRKEGSKPALGRNWQ